MQWSPAYYNSVGLPEAVQKWAGVSDEEVAFTPTYIHKYKELKFRGLDFDPVNVDKHVICGSVLDFNNSPLLLEEIADVIDGVTFTDYSEDLLLNGIDLSDLPEHFQHYSWNKKHNLFAYPTDCYPEFSWINSLETRFQWLKNNIANSNQTPLYLIKEMIQWGGSQNGVLQKFEDGQGDYCLLEVLKEIINNLDNPTKAITSTLKIKGLGLTYASKLLRLLDPNRYGALDSRLCGAFYELPDSPIPKITNGNINSMIKGYVAFTEYLSNTKQQLINHNIKKPNCRLNNSEFWRSADIEMALFEWAANSPERLLWAK